MEGGVQGTEGDRLGQGGREGEHRQVGKDVVREIGRVGGAGGMQGGGGCTLQITTEMTYCVNGCDKRIRSLDRGISLYPIIAANLIISVHLDAAPGRKISTKFFLRKIL